MMRIGDLAIRKKFFLSFALLLTLGFFGGIITYITFSQINNFQQLKIEMAELMLGLAKVHEQQKDFLSSGWKGKDFLETGSSSDIKQINQELNTIQEELNKLAASDAVVNSSLDNDIRLLNNLVVDYDKTFGKLCKLFFKRGFKDYGLEGEMRNYAHNLQMCKSDKEKIFALTLRKHEKDFALRNDTKYVDQLHETAKSFSDFIEAANINYISHMNEEYKIATIAAIKAYRKHFDKIVMVEVEIGLSEKNGLLFELDQQSKKTSPVVNYIYEKINGRNKQLKQHAQLTIGLTIAILIIGSLLLIYFLRKTVSKPIIKLDNIIKKVLSGDPSADKSLDITTKDEIGSLSNNFKLMLESIRENIKIINEKNVALEEKVMIDKERNWSIEGLSKFSEIMKSSENDLPTLCNSIMSALVKYTNSKQGAIFIKEVNREEDELLKLVGCYAYDRRKFIKKSIEKGEGLIGQCWLDREPILLTDVPDSYLNIRSGLGDASPTSVILIPVQFQDELVAVIEMASFNSYGKAMIHFLKEFSTRLGATINSVKLKEQTTNLLFDSQELTVQLKEKEEVIRKNIRVLEAKQIQSTQEIENLNRILFSSKLENEIIYQIVTKIYDGFVVINEEYQIEVISDYVQKELFYDRKDLTGENPEIIFKTSLEFEINSLKNDPNYILNYFSKIRSVTIMDKFGKIHDAFYCLTSVTASNKCYYIVLFNKRLEQKSKKTSKILSK